MVGISKSNATKSTIGATTTFAGGQTNTMIGSEIGADILNYPYSFDQDRS